MIVYVVILEIELIHIKSNNSQRNGHIVSKDLVHKTMNT